MKKIALGTIIVTVVILGIAIGVMGSPAVPANAAVQSSKKTIKLDEARKIALKRVEGKISEEFPIEEEDGTVTSYLFFIKATDGKDWEVMIDAKTGEITSAEEVVE